ncbi:MAG: hypothetical protein G8345_19550, partial [Magnetococcales bacterium]|nr:hypothetical protein [Magnetococcales bacterium]
QMTSVDDWSNLFIRIPTGVSGDFAVDADVVSKGTPSQTSEKVGTYQDTAEVFYQQDKSIYVAETLTAKDPTARALVSTNKDDPSYKTTDDDNAPGRWRVVYIGGDSTHERVYNLTDSDTDLTLDWTPDWATGATTDYVVKNAKGTQQYVAGKYDPNQTLVQQQEDTTVYTAVDGNTSFASKRLVFAPSGYVADTIHLDYIGEQPTLRDDSKSIGTAYTYIPSRISVVPHGFGENKTVEIKNGWNYGYNFDHYWRSNDAEFSIRYWNYQGVSLDRIIINDQGAWTYVTTKEPLSTLPINMLFDNVYDSSSSETPDRTEKYFKEEQYPLVVKGIQDNINEYPFWQLTTKANEFKTWLDPGFTLKDTESQTADVQLQNIIQGIGELQRLEAWHDALTMGKGGYVQEPDGNKTQLFIYDSSSNTYSMAKSIEVWSGGSQNYYNPTSESWSSPQNPNGTYEGVTATFNSIMNWTGTFTANTISNLEAINDYSGNTLGNRISEVDNVMDWVGDLVLMPGMWVTGPIGEQGTYETTVAAGQSYNGYQSMHPFTYKVDNGNYLSGDYVYKTGDPNYYTSRDNIYETFHNYEYMWYGQSHDISDNRDHLQYSWTGASSDISGEVAVSETREILTQSETTKQVIQWRTDPIVESQNAITGSRGYDNKDVPWAAFGQEAILTSGDVVIDAGGDVDLSTLIIAKGGASQVKVTAAGSIHMESVLPDGSPQDTLAASAEIQATNAIVMTAGQDLTMDSGSLLKADTITLTAGQQLTAAGSITAPLGVTLQAVDTLTLAGQITTDGKLVVSSKGAVTGTIGAELSAASMELSGSSMVLTDSSLVAQGKIALTATTDGITLSNDVTLQANALVGEAVTGFKANLQQDSVQDADIRLSGKGDVDVQVAASVKLNHLSTADGTITLFSRQQISHGVLDAGSQGVITIAAAGLTALAESPITANRLNLTLGGSLTATTQVSELKVITRAAGKVTISNKGDDLTLLESDIMDGGFSLLSSGNVTVDSLVLGTSSQQNSVSVEAGGDLTIGALQAGSYSADEQNPGKVANQADVTLKAGGTLAGDDSVPVNIVADQLVVDAATGVAHLSLAVNTVSKVTTTSGDISLSATVGKLADKDGKVVDGRGWTLQEVTTGDGSVTVVSEGDLTVLKVAAAGSQGHISLTTTKGSLTIDEPDSGSALTMSGDLILRADQWLFLEKGYSSAGLLELRAGENIQVNGDDPLDLQAADIVLETGRSLAVDGTLTASHSVELYSDANVFVTGEIKNSGSTPMDHLTILARGERAANIESTDPLTGKLIQPASGQVGLFVDKGVLADQWNVRAKTTITMGSEGSLTIAGVVGGLDDGGAAESITLRSKEGITLQKATLRATTSDLAAETSITSDLTSRIISDTI